MFRERSILNIVLFGVVATIVILAAILLFINLSRPVARVSQPIIYNAFSPDRVSDNSFRYYNGNTFVRYDFASGTTTNLTPNLTRPIENLSEVYWLPDAVVFTVRDAALWSPLYDSFQKTTMPQGKATGVSAYWYLSFASASPEVLFVASSPPPSPITQVGDKLLYFDKLSIKTIGEHKQISATPQIADSMEGYAQPVYTDDSHVYYLYYGSKNINLMRYGLKDKKIDTIEKSLAANQESLPIIDAVMTEPGHIVYVDKSGNKTQYSLKSIDLTTHKRTTLIQPFGGSLTKSGNTITAAYTSTSNILFYTISNGKLALSAKIDDDYSVPYQAQCVGSNCYYFESGGIVRLITNDKDKLAAIKPGYHGALEDKVKSNQFSLNRAVMSYEDNAYVFTIINGKLEDRYKEALAAIRQSGHDPLQVTLITTPGRLVEY